MSEKTPPVDDAPVVVRHDEVGGVRTGVAVIVLNRPDRLNALTVEMGDEFERAVTALAADPRVRAVVLTGAGRAFSAGGDLDFLDARASDQPQRNSEQMRAFYRRFLSIRQLPVPVIAAVHGAAIGAGACLALACDLRVCGQDIKFGLTFVKLGLHPGMGATALLPALVGHQTAARLLLTGDVIDGDEAMAIGLAAEVCPRADVQTRALALARRMAEAAPVAVRSTVRSLRLQQAPSIEQALWREADAQAHSYATADLRRGIEAVRKKESPVFLGD